MNMQYRYISENLFGNPIKSITRTREVSPRELGLDINLESICYDQLPYSMLIEIAQTIDVKNYMLMEYETLTQAISKILGKNQRDWSYLVQSKYKNEDLGVRLYSCFKPKLQNPSDRWLTSGDISDNLSLFGNQTELDFHNYFPVNAGFIYQTKMMKRKSKHGFVINTSRKADKGCHWVSVYIDVNTKRMEYFDSFGRLPNQDVIDTLQSIIDCLNAVFPEKCLGYIVRYNTKQKQRDAEQCGVWCILFLVSRLRGKSLKEFANLNITDRDCFNLRSYLFQL